MMRDERSPWRAKVAPHWPTDSLRAMVRGPGYIRVWNQRTATAVDEDAGVEPNVPDGLVPYLELTEEEARALYEALADHFGHTGVDTRHLRRDYEAERARVDRLVDFAMATGRTLIAARQGER